MDIFCGRSLIAPTVVQLRFRRGDLRSPVGLRFLYKLFSAFGAGDGDFAFATGDTDLLAATGTIVVTVIPVLQPLEEHEKFFVFPVPLIGISGKTAEDHPN